MFLMVSGDTLLKALLNTLMGMGSVFIILIFISFLISLFKFIPAFLALFEKKEKEAPVVAAPAVQPASQKAATNLTDDAQLVAVITAAIYASEEACGHAVSKDTLVVRSIRRSK